VGSWLGQRGLEVADALVLDSGSGSRFGPDFDSDSDFGSDFGSDSGPVSLVLVQV
jgi:hypothetical protein